MPDNLEREISVFEACLNNILQPGDLDEAVVNGIIYQWDRLKEEVEKLIKN
jgi:hypothetical protein